MTDIKLIAATNEKKPEKVVTQIVDGKVSRKNRSLGKKFSDVFLEEDAKSVKNYIFSDVLVPAIKETVRDIAVNTIEMFLFGQIKGKNTTRQGDRSYVSFGSAYRNGSSSISNSSKRNLGRNRASHDFDDIFFENRGEAEQVLSSLVDLIADYGQASVADLYTLVGIVPNFTDNNWGWDELASAYVKRTRDGYVIDLPRTIPLD